MLLPDGLCVPSSYHLGGHQAQAYINALALALAHMTADKASTGKLVNPDDVVRVVSVHSKDAYQWSAFFVFAFWRGLVFAKRAAAASSEGPTSPSAVVGPPLPPEEETALLQLAINHSSAVCACCGQWMHLLMT